MMEKIAGHDLEELSSHVRVCISVFVALMALTMITVTVSYLDLPVPAAISLALCIALVKGSMVVAIFMHLVSEKKIIFWSLSITVIFFFILMTIPVLTQEDIIKQTIEVRH